MQNGPPLRMAYGVATLRAVHQVADRPLVFADPFALRVIGVKSASDMRAYCDPQRLAASGSVRAFVTARSRYAEDEWGRAMEQGVRQYVILGAGLDTYAYRQARGMSAARVFEVDHPQTQAWKIQCLRAADITAPASLTYVPVDVTRESLPDRLAQAGFRADEPAFFSCLGVVIFLERAVIEKTFRFAASMPAGSQIVFDYGVPSAQLDEAQRREREAAASQAASMGEPLRTFLDTASLADDLCRMGFARTENLCPQSINDRYFSGRTDGLRVAAGGRRIMRAWR